ncbi:peptidase [Nocardioides sp. S5]|uniref:KPN_02809 family neutral zinc metallopeptidase n=1 Tax=Nocardioides sp. S5 TaxID=2017486 RepID=UPI001A9021B6|nr:neutral zinc metallopeptidase [Nocardioides sp. S5]QSR31448.1 peptidase [Nocardioides sp. S5]
MRFNPKARLDTSRVREGGGGGASGGPMRIPLPGGTKAGGGIGAVLIVILFLILQQCAGGGLPSPGGGTSAGTDTSRMQDSERYANCKTGDDANSDEDCARVAVENSLVDYWAEALPSQSETQFSPASMTTFSGAVTTGCGQASSQVGPFYCPPDQGIYLDTTFFADVLEGQLGGQGGDFVEPYVLAHEYGHHVQNLMGTMGRVRTQQGADSDAVRLELQADCYAGMWTAHAEDSELITLDDGDITEALDSAKAVGDDRIQQKSGQGVDPEGWTHGSSEQRMAWFTRGYEEGSLEACDTFSASDL